ncbi:MAG TPA: endolytic transglycosylase MltG [Candidatus Acidoferrales bacterium]|nr:endolytic transglycosylase MltG [Candidatus Acidoferrales bacterium]
MRSVFALLFLAVVLLAAWLACALCVPVRGLPPEGVFVDIPHGASVRTIAHLLAEKGVLRSRIAFIALARWRSRSRLQAGEYFFNHPVNAIEVFHTLAEGRVYVVVVVVPEGANKFDVAELVERAGLVSRAAFLEAVSDPTPIRDLAPSARSLEGFLFPASYPFPHHVTPQEITKAMTDRFRGAWAKLAETSGTRNGLRLEEVVALASLVERETPLPEERSLVAAVFVNRLRLGRALQCDPTVIYALELAGQYNGQLDAGDLNFNSPYNTYRRPGLPPGPIANPGEASLRAALGPAPVDYLYFVANTRGGHFFSRTLDEHNQYVARYRRLLAENHPGPDDGGKSADARRQKPRRQRLP